MFGLGLGRLGASGSGAFSPSSVAGKRLWLRPSVTAGMWQDSAGTTPMSAVGTLLDTSNPVGLMLDYSGQGLALIQATSTARPVLSARRNYAVRTESATLGDGHTGWIMPDGTLIDDIADPHGGTKAVEFSGKVLRVGLSLHPINADLELRFHARRLSGSGPLTVTDENTGATKLTYSPTSGWSEFVCTINVPYAQNISIVKSATDQVVQIAFPYLGEAGGGYQRVNTTSDYTPVTPQYVKYDGTDDALASATFTAGTLGSNVDAFMVVRRDTAGNVTLGYPTPGATTFFGMAESGSGSVCHASVGTPTVWVNGVQLSGGTSVTRGTLHTALTVGDWHVVEFRNLDLSAWTQFGQGGHTGYLLNGAMGERLIADAMPDATRAKVRTYLGKTVGKVL